MSQMEIVSNVDWFAIYKLFIGSKSSWSAAEMCDKSGEWIKKKKITAKHITKVTTTQTISTKYTVNWPTLEKKEKNANLFEFVWIWEKLKLILNWWRRNLTCGECIIKTELMTVINMAKQFFERCLKATKPSRAQRATQRAEHTAKLNMCLLLCCG